MAKSQVDTSWAPQAGEPYAICPNCGQQVPVDAMTCPHVGCGAEFEPEGDDGFPSDPRVLLSAICAEVAEMQFKKRTRGPAVEAVAAACLDAIHTHAPAQPDRLVGLAALTAAYMDVVADLVRRGQVPPAIDTVLLERVAAKFGGSGE